ncbi:MAG: hypothetical protein DHS20C16_03040 [Phycisphaerae bacterium]|nr:MAG: hypothetical protein DHS20C16_03040 [Phycisphaerae bacterium]
MVAHRAAFTMVELVVSVGVLAIMLVMTGAIFTLTLKSSGEANAVIEVSQAARALEAQLIEDLKYVQPHQTIMVIQGNPILAYQTLDDNEADDDGDPRTPIRRDPSREVIDEASGELRAEMPRADVLMFFTARPGKSYRNPSISGRMQQVVYGHAELGVWNKDGTWQLDPNDPNNYRRFPTWTDQNPIPDSNQPANPFAPINVPEREAFLKNFPPAREWHLARRSVLVLDRLGVPVPANSFNDSGQYQAGNDDDPDFSVVSRVNFVRDGRHDYVVNRLPIDITTGPKNNSSTSFRYGDFIQKMTPYPDPTVITGPGIGHEVSIDSDDCCDQPGAYEDQFFNEGLVGVEPDPTEFRHWIVPWFARSQMDPNPPLEQSKRLGHYFLPNCAGFKVEWALTSEIPEVNECLDLFDDTIWVDPADLGATTALIHGKINDMLERIKNNEEGYRPGPPGGPGEVFFEKYKECNLSDKPLGLILSALARDTGSAAPMAVFQEAGNFLPELDSLTPDPQLGRRFDSDIVGTNHLFYAKNPDPKGESPLGPPFSDMLTDPFFPSALRITVDLFDSANRLERPIRHVMIIPVGQ